MIGTKAFYYDPIINPLPACLVNVEDRGTWTMNMFGVGTYYTGFRVDGTNLKRWVVYMDSYIKDILAVVPSTLKSLYITLYMGQGS